MAQGIYVYSPGHKYQQSLIALALYKAMQRKSALVYYYRPIIEEDDLNDIKLLNDIKFIDEKNILYGVKCPTNDILIQRHYNSILKKYDALEKDAVVVCDSAIHHDLSFEFIHQSQLSVMLVLDGTSPNIAKQYEVHKNFLHSKGLYIEYLCVLRAQETLQSIKKQIDDNPVMLALKETDDIFSASLDDVYQNLPIKVISNEDLTPYPIEGITVISKNIKEVIDQNLIKKGHLIVTSIDRLDVIMTVVSMSQLNSVKKPAGILLTTGTKLPKSIEKLLKNNESILPIMLTNMDTYSACASLYHLVSQTPLSLNTYRLMQAKKAFTNRLYKKISLVKKRASTSNMISPHMFKYSLIQKAAQTKANILFPESYDLRILQAVHELLQHDCMEITLLGDRDKIQEIALEKGFDSLHKANVIDPHDPKRLKQYSSFVYEQRKHKGLTKELSLDMVMDINYFATCMVALGEVDGMVSGATHTTANTVRPALQLVKTSKDVKKVSSIFIMCMKDRLMIYGDCAINPYPSAEELAEIAVLSAKNAQKLGIDPKIGLLSYTSGDGASGNKIDRIKKAYNILMKKHPSLPLEGPIQYDAAVDLEVAKKKLPNSKIAGHINVCIFPDLNTGNNTYKAVQRESNAIAIGPILQGLNKPINDLSRGALVDDIIYTALITAIQAKESS